MRVKLLTRWCGDDNARPGDIVEMDDDNARHHLSRGTCTMPDVPAEPATADEPTADAEPIAADTGDAPDEPTAPPAHGGKHKNRR